MTYPLHSSDSLTPTDSDSANRRGGDANDVDILRDVRSKDAGIDRLHGHEAIDFISQFVSARVPPVVDDFVLQRVFEASFSGSDSSSKSSVECVGVKSDSGLELRSPSAAKTDTNSSRFRDFSRRLVSDKHGKVNKISPRPGSKEMREGGAKVSTFRRDHLSRLLIINGVNASIEMLQREYKDVEREAEIRDINLHLDKLDAQVSGTDFASKECEDLMRRMLLVSYRELAVPSVNALLQASHAEKKKREVFCDLYDIMRNLSKADVSRNFFSTFIDCNRVKNKTSVDNSHNHLSANMLVTRSTLLTQMDIFVCMLASETKRDNMGDLLCSLYEGIFGILTSMPLGSLKTFSEWESERFDRLVRKLFDAQMLFRCSAENSTVDFSFLRSSAKLITLFISIQRGALNETLESLYDILTDPECSRIELTSSAKSMIAQICHPAIFSPMGLASYFAKGSIPLRSFTLYAKDGIQKQNSHIMAPFNWKKLTRPFLGDIVELRKEMQSSNALEHGERACVVEDDGGVRPFRLFSGRGLISAWYSPTELIIVKRHTYPFDSNEIYQMMKNNFSYSQFLHEQEIFAAVSKIRASESYLSLSNSFFRDTIAISKDSRFLYRYGDLIEGVLKVGTGFGSASKCSTVEGKIYGYIPLRFVGKSPPYNWCNGFYAKGTCVWVAEIGDDVVLVSRRSGTLQLTIEKLDFQNFSIASNSSPPSHSLSMVNEIALEQVSVLQGNHMLLISVSESYGITIEVSHQALMHSLASDINLWTTPVVTWCERSMPSLRIDEEWFFEFRIDRMGSVSVGWGDAGSPDSSSHFSDISSLTFNISDSTLTDTFGASTTFGQRCVAGDIVGCRLAFNSSQNEMSVYFSRNGSWNFPFGLASTWVGKWTAIQPLVFFNKPAQALDESSNPSISKVSENDSLEETNSKPSLSTQELAKITFLSKGDSLPELSSFSSRAPRIFRPTHTYKYGSVLDDVDGERSVGILPPLATDGTLIYCMQLRSTFSVDSIREDSLRGPDNHRFSLAIDVLNPASIPLLVRRIVIPNTIEFPLGFPEIRRFFDWRMFTNGDELIIFHEEELPDDVFISEKIRSIKAGHISLADLPVEDLHCFSGDVLFGAGPPEQSQSSSDCWQKIPAFDHFPITKPRTVLLKGTEYKNVDYVADSCAFSKDSSLVWSWCQADGRIRLHSVESLRFTMTETQHSQVLCLLKSCTTPFELMTLILHVITVIGHPVLIPPPDGSIFRFVINDIIKPKTSFKVFRHLCQASLYSTAIFQRSAALFDGYLESASHAMPFALKLLESILERSLTMDVSLFCIGFSSCLRALEMLLHHLSMLKTRLTSNNAIHLIDLWKKLFSHESVPFGTKLDAMNLLLQYLGTVFHDDYVLLDFVLAHIDMVDKSKTIGELRTLWIGLLGGVVQYIAAKVIVSSLEFRLRVSNKLILRLFEWAKTDFVTRVKALTEPAFVAMDCELEDNAEVVFCDAFNILLNSLLVAEFCERCEAHVSATSLILFSVLNKICAEGSSLLLTACELATQIKACDESVKRLAHAVNILENSFLGRVFPTASCWIQFYLCEKGKSDFVMTRILSKASLLKNLSDFVSNFAAFMSAVNVNKDIAVETREKKLLVRSNSTMETAVALAKLTADPNLDEDNSNDVYFLNELVVVRGCLSFNWLPKLRRKTVRIGVPDSSVLTFALRHTVIDGEKAGFLRFLRDSGSLDLFPAYAKPNERWGEERYSVNRSLPGFGNSHPLLLPASRVIVAFDSEEESEPLIEIMAGSIHYRRTCVQKRPWRDHFSTVCRETVSCIISAAVGQPSTLDPIESRYLRWIQNPIFSGGLQNLSKSTEFIRGLWISFQFCNPRLENGSFSRSRSRTLSLTEEDRIASDEMLLELLSNEKSPPGLGGVLIKRLREHRVPLDQGFYTHRAVNAFACVLIRVNNLELEALRLARACQKSEFDQKESTPSSRLLLMWRFAQYIRKWADDIVANRQVKYHIEASFSDSEPFKKELLKAICVSANHDDPEEPLYFALSEIIAFRARFLVHMIAKPRLRYAKSRSVSVDAARARWHRLGLHFCPKARKRIEEARFVQRVRSILRSRSSSILKSATQSISSKEKSMLRLPSSRSQLARRLSLEVLTATRSAFKKPNESLENEDSKSSLLISMQPINGHREEKRSTRLIRYASQGNYASRHSRNDTFTDRNRLHSGSFRQNRMWERVAGGFRHSSGIDKSEDIDLSLQDHYQSFSESVRLFLQNTMPIDHALLKTSLEKRNERAASRIAGLLFSNFLLHAARQHQACPEGFLLFDCVISSLADALHKPRTTHALSLYSGAQVCRLLRNHAHFGSLKSCSSMASDTPIVDHGFSASSDDDSLSVSIENALAVSGSEFIEAHYLSDLAGCSAILIEHVQKSFSDLLSTISHLVRLIVRQLSMLGSTPVVPGETLRKTIVTSLPTMSLNSVKDVAPLVKHLNYRIGELLKVISQDFVESDFQLLIASDVISALRVSLFYKCSGENNALKSVQDMAWDCLEILIRRCICEANATKTKANSGFESGTKFQQSLLDLLLDLMDVSYVSSASSAGGKFLCTCETNKLDTASSDLKAMESYLVKLPMSSLSTSQMLDDSMMFRQYVSYLSNSLNLQGDCVIRFRIHLISQAWKEGKIFSFGTPGNRSSRSRHVPKGSKPTVKCVWIEVGMDDHRRISVSFGDVYGFKIVVISNNPLLLDVCYEISVRIRNFDDLELIVVRGEILEESKESDSCVAMREIFPGVLHELGKPVVDMFMLSPSLSELVGSFVRVRGGFFRGCTGKVIGISDSIACVCLDFSSVVDFWGQSSSMQSTFPEEDLIPHHVICVRTSCIARLKYSTPPLFHCAWSIVCKRIKEDRGRFEKPILGSDKSFRSNEFTSDFINKSADFLSDQYMTGLLSDWGFDKNEISQTLSVYRSAVSKASNCLRNKTKTEAGVDDDLFLCAPISIGSFRNTPHSSHDCAEGVVLKCLEVLPHVRFFSQSATIETRYVRVNESVIPSAYNGGIILSYPFAPISMASLFGASLDNVEQAQNEPAVAKAKSFEFSYDAAESQEMRMLSLVYFACSTSIGRARLCAPFPLQLLIRRCIGNFDSLRVRIATLGILESVLPHVQPYETVPVVSAAMEALDIPILVDDSIGENALVKIFCGLIGNLLSPFSSSTVAPNLLLHWSGEESATMAFHYVKLLHTICSSEAWASSVSTCIEDLLQCLCEVCKDIGHVNVMEAKEVIMNATGALAVLGGFHDYFYYGCHALAILDDNRSSKKQVLILDPVPAADVSKNQISDSYFRSPSGRLENLIRDITSQCEARLSGLGADIITSMSRLDEQDCIRQSNGELPSWIQITCPAGAIIHSLDISVSLKQSKNCAKSVDIWVGECPGGLRNVRRVVLSKSAKWQSIVSAEDVRTTDRLIRIECSSAHGRNLEMSIRKLRLFAHVETDVDNDIFEPAEKQYFVQQLNENSNDAGHAFTNRTSGIFALKESKLSTKLLSPPQSLLCSLRGEVAKHLGLILSFHPTSMSATELRLRAAKAVHMLLKQGLHTAILGSEVFSFLIRKQSIRHNLALSNLNNLVEVPFQWKVERAFENKSRIYASDNGQSLISPEAEEKRRHGDSVNSATYNCADLTFEPAGKLHRAVCLDSPSMKTGRHYWECTLLADVAGDETAMIGVALSTYKFSNIYQTHDNILDPSESFWFLQCYNGARIHKDISGTWEGSKNLHVHPGDTVYFYLNMDNGELKIQVNDSPKFLIFEQIHINAVCGVKPCVATYGNSADVKFRISNLYMFHEDLGSEAVSRKMLMNGTNNDISASAAFTAMQTFKRLDECEACIKDLRKSSSNACTLVDAASERKQAPRTSMRWLDQEVSIRKSADSSLQLGSEAVSMVKDKSAYSNVGMFTNRRLNEFGIHPTISPMRDRTAIQELEDMSVLYSIESSSAKSIRLPGLTFNDQSLVYNRRIRLLCENIFANARYSLGADGLAQCGALIFDNACDRYEEFILQRLVVDWYLPLASFNIFLTPDHEVLRMVDLLCQKNISGEGTTRKLLPPHLEKNIMDGLMKPEVIASVVDLCERIFGATGDLLAKSHEEVDIWSRKHQNEYEEGLQKMLSSLMPYNNSNNSGGFSRFSEPFKQLRNSIDTKSEKLKSGDKVVARYKAGENWYSGKISKVLGDGTYLIDYDDGDQESHVRSEFVTSVEPISNVSPSESHLDNSNGLDSLQQRFSVDQAVQVRTSVSSKWVPSFITHVHGNELYDVKFSNGLSEHYVSATCIRVADSEDSSEGFSEFGQSHSPFEFLNLLPGFAQSISSSLSTRLLKDMSRKDICMLVSDRYFGDIPASGKADTAQVSIINCPAPANGFVKLLRLRLAKSPGNQSRFWNVVVFERAGETNNFFVVPNSASRPSCGKIEYDPHSVGLQTVPVIGNVYIMQGQYLGVINPAGRLNLAYTPGKKKFEESWSTKPVEVFYMMRKSADTPFAGGPHRTRSWHGRAGWCAFVFATNIITPETTQVLLRQGAESVLSRHLCSGVTLQSSLVTTSFLLTLLLRCDIVSAKKLLSSSTISNSLQCVLEFGLFFATGDVSDSSSARHSIYSVWVPILDMVSEICESILNIPSTEAETFSLGATETIALLRIQLAIEAKANEMFFLRRRRVRDSVHLSKTGKTNSSRSSEFDEYRAVTETEIHPDAHIKESGNSMLENGHKRLDLFSGVWFQSLLKCLVNVDTVTRRDGLDGLSKLVDFPRHDTSTENVADHFDVSFLAQKISTPSVIKYALCDGAIYVSEIRDMCFDSDDEGEAVNIEEAHSLLRIGDRLTSVENIKVDLSKADCVFSASLLATAIAGPKLGVTRASGSEEEKPFTKGALDSAFLNEDDRKAFHFMLPRNTNGLPMRQRNKLRESLSVSESQRKAADALRRIFDKGQVSLKFSRQKGSNAYDQLQARAHSAFYCGVGRRLGETQAVAGSSLPLREVNDWLNELVAATKLLRAFSSCQLPSHHFLHAHFDSWCRSKRAAVLRSPSLLFRNHAPIGNSLLSFTAEKSRFYSDSPDSLQTLREPILKQFQNDVEFPGAIALRLQWDRRSCTIMDSNAFSIVVNVGNDIICGSYGLPPNVSMVSGSKVRVDIVQNGNVSASSGSNKSKVSSNAAGFVMAGLQNRAGAQVWLGLTRGSRASFYCGRPWFSVVGWSPMHYMCGPYGDQQCPDCANVVVRNMAGRVMAKLQKSDFPLANEDTLYCDGCKSDSMPISCADCEKFKSILIGTQYFIDVPFLRLSDFDTADAYCHFLSELLIPGLAVKIVQSNISELPTDTLGIVWTLDGNYECTLKLMSSFIDTQKLVQVHFKHLELVSASEISTFDFRKKFAGREMNLDVLQTLQRTRGYTSNANESSTGKEDLEYYASEDGNRFLENSDIISTSEFADYMSRKCDIGCMVRSVVAFEAVQEGDTGVIVNIDEEDRFPCQVDWVGLGTKLWVPWSCLSLNVKLHEVLPGSDDISKYVDPVKFRQGCQFNAQVGIKAEDIKDVRFASKAFVSGIECYNNNRSVSRSSNTGWRYQILNHRLDSTVGIMNITFSIDASTSLLVFSILSFDNGSLETLAKACEQDLNPMETPGFWGLCSNGSTSANGKLTEEGMNLKLFTSGDIVTLSIDKIEGSATFFVGSHVLHSIFDLPQKMVVAVGLSSSYQRISICAAQIDSTSTLHPIPGWGYRVSVEPVFDLRSLNEDKSAIKSDSNMSKSIVSTYPEFCRQQSLWSHECDKLLATFVNDVVDRVNISLDALLKLKWEVLIFLSRISLQPSLHSNELRGSVSSDGIGKESDDGYILVAQDSLKNLIIAKKDQHSDGELEKAQKLSSNQLGVINLHADGKVKVVSNQIVFLSVAQLQSILSDIERRFGVLHAFNVYVYRELSLLDLDSWKDASGAAAQLSKCSSFLYVKLKYAMWNDALTHTRSEDETPFDLVLDYGKASSHKLMEDTQGQFTLFGQAFRKMQPMQPKSLRRHNRLYTCLLRGMASHDDGGPYRQSFNEYCREFQSLPGLGLMLPCGNRANQIIANQDRWLPNPSATTSLQEEMYEFVGKLMGIAIRTNELLDLRLPSLVWKLLVNRLPTIGDLRAIDFVTANSVELAYDGDKLIECVDPTQLETLQNMLDSDELVYTVVALDGRDVELVPGGSAVPVTVDNYLDWARLVVEYKLHEFDLQVDAIRRGLSTIVPQRLLVCFKWEELELMVCGRPRLDLSLLREMTIYFGCSESDPHIKAFWQVLESFSDQQLADYLKFVWGRSRLPLNAAGWERRHTIAAFTSRNSSSLGGDGEDEYLPYAHTCYFTLDLPAYSSKEILKTRLLYAIENCVEIDGDQTVAGRRALGMGFELGGEDDDGISQSDLSSEDNSLDVSFDLNGEALELPQSIGRRFPSILVDADRVNSDMRVDLYGENPETNLEHNRFTQPIWEGDEDPFSEFADRF